MDQCWTKNYHLGLIFLFNYTFYSCYNTNWIANKDIGLDPNNSVIKRLWCSKQVTFFVVEKYDKNAVHINMTLMPFLMYKRE